MAILIFSNLLEMEITPQGSVLTWLTIFATLFAATRAVNTTEFTTGLFRPGQMMLDVIRDIHYYPETWKDRLSSEDVSSYLITHRRRACS